MHISYSELRVYRQCPKCYRHRYVERLPEKPGRDKLAFWGVVVGKLVEAFYRERWWADPIMAESDARRFLSAEAQRRTEVKQVDWGPGEFEVGLEKAKAAVPKILSTVRTERLLGARNWVEQEMTLPITSGGDTHTVHGRLDFLVEAPDRRLTLIDGKAGATLGRRSDPEQLKLYALMVERHYGQLPARAGFWWFRHGVVRWKKLTHLSEFAAGLDGTLNRIRRECFAPVVGAHCQWCDYWAACPAGQEQTAEKAVPGLDLIPGTVTVVGA